MVRKETPTYHFGPHIGRDVRLCCRVPRYRCVGAATQRAAEVKASSERALRGSVALGDRTRTQLDAAGCEAQRAVVVWQRAAHRAHREREQVYRAHEHGRIARVRMRLRIGKRISQHWRRLQRRGSVAQVALQQRRRACTQEWAARQAHRSIAIRAAHDRTDDAQYLEEARHVARRRKVRQHAVQKVVGRRSVHRRGQGEGLRKARHKEVLIGIPKRCKCRDGNGDRRAVASSLEERHGTTGQARPQYRPRVLVLAARLVQRGALDAAHKLEACTRRNEIERSLNHRRTQRHKDTLQQRLAQRGRQRLCLVGAVSPRRAQTRDELVDDLRGDQESRAPVLAAHVLDERGSHDIGHVRQCMRRAPAQHSWPKERVRRQRTQRAV